MYTAALSVALEHLGYEPRTAPGEPLRFHQGDVALEPRSIVRQYLAGELSDDEWQSTWADAGLHDRPWSDIAWKAAPSVT